MFPPTTIEAKTPELHLLTPVDTKAIARSTHVFLLWRLGFRDILAAPEKPHHACNYRQRHDCARFFYDHSTMPPNIGGRSHKRILGLVRWW